MIKKQKTLAPNLFSLSRYFIHAIIVFVSNELAYLSGPFVIVSLHKPVLACRSLKAVVLLSEYVIVWSNSRKAKPRTS